MGAYGRFFGWGNPKFSNSDHFDGETDDFCGVSQLEDIAVLISTMVIQYEFS
jgi:hypothetical protein